MSHYPAPGPGSLPPPLPQFVHLTRKLEMLDISCNTEKYENDLRGLKPRNTNGSKLEAATKVLV
jgi:hypothetical protein